MTDRPILFSGPMVRALLDGSKTQTRRVVSQRHLPQIDLSRGAVVANWSKPMPYGQPGDRLWVRETFYAFGRWETRYSAKKGRDEWHFIDMTAECGNWYFYDATSQPDAEKFRRSSITPMWWKRPAIFMPRWASRITLEITGVRVERLHEISAADAMAEGMESYALNGKPSVTGKLNLPSEYYRYLWETINGAGSWDANPWVWVVEFRRQA